MTPLRRAHDLEEEPVAAWVLAKFLVDEPEAACHRAHGGRAHTLDVGILLHTPWYDPEGRWYVGRSEAEARAENELAADVVLRQDDDVLDTWFSSAPWPFSTQGWPAQTRDLSLLPNFRVSTGFDIIFFWVARMIMMGLKFTGEVPFTARCTCTA